MSPRSGYPLAVRTAFSSKPGPERSPSAFTLVEMLVVIAIIAMLASMLVPVTGKALESARRTTCASQLRQFHQASVVYANENGFLLPAVCDERGFGGRFSWPATWPFALAEYLGYPELTPGTRLDDGPRRNTLFTCPSYRNSPAFHVWNSPWDRNLLGGYGMNRNMDLDRGATPDGNWARQYITRADLAAPNPSSRLMFADGSGRNGDLGTRFDFNRYGQASFQYLVDPNRHGGGSNLCFMDGHVTFVRESLIVSRGLTGALFVD